MYEYQCTRCQRRVEKIQSFSAEPLTVCEACGGPLEKLISAPAIQFKGSGWYVTDYAHKSGSGSGSGSHSHSESSSEPSKDSKESNGNSASGGSGAPAPSAESKPASAPSKPADK